MKVVAIAGGISSGKSMVCGIVEQLGGHFVGVDGLSRNLMDPHSSPSCFDQVVKEFGKEILNNNKIDKCRLGQVLFKTNGFNRIKRIIMPSLFEVVSNEIEQCRSRNYQYLFWDRRSQGSSQ
jgi:dephospho-CoA kinase